MMHAIDLENLSKTFELKKGRAVEAVKNISLSIEAGEIFGFLGPNGAGKSTTIRVLMGLISPSTGRARILGQDAHSPFSRKHVGYLPENPSFYDYLTGHEYILFVGRSFAMSSATASEEAAKVLKLLDLWDVRNRRISSYSKGMVQRLGLAQVLIHDPAVYILDEPMSGLDPIGRALVKDIILKLKQQGKSVFFSTHITSDVEAICDRVGIIMNGSLRSIKEVASIMREGVLGYILHIKDKRTSEIINKNVTKERLAHALDEAEKLGNEVTMVEPRRKNVEDFFLDVVRDEAC